MNPFTASDSLPAVVKISEMTFLQNMSNIFTYGMPGSCDRIVNSRVRAFEAHAASAQSNGKFKYAVHADADAWPDSENSQQRRFNG